MFIFHNFVRIIILLVAFVMLMKTSTAVRLFHFHVLIITFFETQKQPPEVFYKRSCFQKCRNTQRKTSVLESLFNKVADRQACNIFKKRFQHSCFPVKIAKFLRTPIFVLLYFPQVLIAALWTTIISITSLHLKLRMLMDRIYATWINKNDKEWKVPLNCNTLLCLVVRGCWMEN